ncbi:MAG: SoxR reducing system RseC family protein [Sulfuricellaceae bacterium]|nr:SoxR reducing system RseC family protein [Sulfuricellaceae bacterium]
MLEAEGTIVSTTPDETWVETSRASACGSCSSKDGCGTTTLNQMLGTKKSAFKVLNPIGARAGERVVIGVEEAALLKSSALVYLLPLVLLLLGAMLGGLLAPDNTQPDAYAAAGMLAGLIAGFFLLKRVSDGAKGNRAFQPVILRRSINFIRFAEDQNK